MSAYFILATKLAERFPSDAACALEPLPESDVAAFLAAMKPQAAAPVLRAMAPTLARGILLGLETKAAAAIADQLPIPWVAAMLRSADGMHKDDILRQVTASHAQAIRRLLSFPSGSAGALAEPDVLILRDNANPELALDQIRARPDVERIYLVNRETRLVGVTNIAAVVAAAPNQTLGSIMDSQVHAVNAGQSAAALVDHPAWATERALPVVDNDGSIVGALAYEAILRLVAKNPATHPNLVALPVSLAELFWLGLSGITQGIAHTAISEDSDAG